MMVATLTLTTSISRNKFNNN